MLISEIKNKEVRELAEHYARTRPSACSCHGNKEILEDSFYWSETQEGYDFWSAINDGLDLELPQTVIVEMQMPRLPPGWSHTGEYRKSVKGVDYIYCDGKVVLSRGQELAYPIVVRVSE